MFVLDGVVSRSSICLSEKKSLLYHVVELMLEYFGNVIVAIS